MRRGIRITLYIAALALVSLGVGVVCRWYLPPAGTVSTAVCERSEVAVGDAVDVICTASLPWRDRVQEVSADLAPEGRLRLINWSATYLGTSWGAHEWLVTAQVQALAAGQYRIPPLRLTTSSGELVTTGDPAFQASGVLPEGFVDPLPAAGIAAPPPRNIAWLWLLAGAVLVLFGIAAALLSRKAAPVELTPSEKLRTKLARLSDTSLLAPAMFYQILLDALRSYLSSAWGVPATVRTKDELFAGLTEGYPCPPAELRDLLKKIWEESDQVRFAHTAPSAGRMSEAVGLAEAFLNGSEELLTTEEAHV